MEMISKYLVFHDDGALSSYEPQTKDEILEYYNEHRFNSVDGKEMYPNLKTLKAVQYYCGVKIYNIKPIK